MGEVSFWRGFFWCFGGNLALTVGEPFTPILQNWDADIQDEVLEECINFGPVVHIHLDKVRR